MYQIKTSARQRAKSKAIPAPVGGWNARDALADMKETDAVILDNWWPSEGKVELRKGWAQHVTGLGGWVETLIDYEYQGTRKMIAGANGNLWDATTAATSLGSGFSSNQWGHAQLDGTLGLVNGTDKQSYNGTTLSAMTVTGPTAPIGVHVFKGRSYFWDADSQSFWYSAINTMGGTVSEFPLGRVSDFGGNLVTMGTWTRDGGDGIDDFAVFLMSSGDCILYQGSDPGDAANWSLVGVYRMAAPVGNDPLLQYNGDLIATTVDGYVSLREVLRERTPSISNKIRSAAQSAATIGKSLSGWDSTYFPAANMLLFNVPISTTQTVQHVVNTTTGAWARFTGWDSRSATTFNDLLYMGGNGTIYKAWSGTSDDGVAINADALPAYNYFNGANLKQVTAVQPYFFANAAIELSVITEKDFVISPRPSANLSIGSSSSPWGSPWGSPWSVGNELFAPTKTVTKVGRALSARIVVQTRNHSLQWFSTTYFYKTGGFI